MYGRRQGEGSQKVRLYRLCSLRCYRQAPPGPTEEEGIPDVEDEEVENNEEEVKEMRLTFEGFELVCEIGLSFLPR